MTLSPEDRCNKIIKIDKKINGTPCYIGQYKYATISRGSDASQYPVFIDLCDYTKKHLYPFTLVGIMCKGLTICNNDKASLPIDLEITGVDEV